jgi:hypothetical protein
MNRVLLTRPEAELRYEQGTADEITEADEDENDSVIMIGDSRPTGNGAGARIITKDNIVKPPPYHTIVPPWPEEDDY